MYDIFFISYDETYADMAYQRLRERLPIVNRVTGINGIHNAHIECAKRSKTSHFFVIDADNRIDDYDVFSYQIPVYDEPYVHLWYAKNPVNGLIYGWGGVKLFPKAVFDDLDQMPLDMTTSFPLKIIKTVVSTSQFNTSPFETWRAAFRECVKLSAAEQTEETVERLRIWTTVAKGPYAEYCLLGAKAGLAHTKENSFLINDYKWLREQFAQST